VTELHTERGRGLAARLRRAYELRRLGLTGGPDRQRWQAGAAAAAGAVGLAAAAAVISVSVLGQSPAPAPTLGDLLTDTVSHVGAVRLLTQIADAAARPRPASVTGRQFTYVESMVSFDTDGSSPAPAQTHLRQSWTPAANLCTGGLIIEYGQRYGLPAPAAPTAPGGKKCPDRGTLASGPTYPLLQSLPASPKAVLHLLRPAQKGVLPPDEVAFSTIGNIQQSVVPPDASAALYRAAALLPEITLAPTVSDAAGRPGMVVRFLYRAAQIDWVFDPHTLRLLGVLDYSNGTLTGETAILSQGIVDRAGELPARGQTQTPSQPGTSG
jgi:hypothetical protein